MNNKDKVVIVVLGGVVQAVRATAKDLEVQIIDFDDLACEMDKGELVQIPDDLFVVY